MKCSRGEPFHFNSCGSLVDRPVDLTKYKNSQQNNRTTLTMKSQRTIQGTPLSLSPQGVSFSEVNVREFDVTCFSGRVRGPALSLDWTYSEQPALPIGEYEKSRTQRRSLDELRLDERARRRRLIEGFGFTGAQLDRVHMFKLHRNKSAPCRMTHSSTHSRETCNNRTSTTTLPFKRPLSRRDTSLVESRNTGSSPR